MLKKDEGVLLTVFGGLLLAFIILLSVVACNPGSSGAQYYPQDNVHGYYDVHHHYHYYPKYKSGRVVVVKPPQKCTCKVNTGPKVSLRKR